MKLDSMVFNTMFKMHVLHSIPGRIRVHVPAAKKIPKEWHLDQTYQALMNQVDGVIAFSMSYETANAIIQYDTKKTTEEKVLKTLKEMIYLGYQYREELIDFDSSQKEEAVEYFIKILENHMGLKFNKK